jgi:hypothetical protein
MATARCYTCHTLRPLSDFTYRRKDGGISASSRLKRYVGVLLQRPGAAKFDTRNNNTAGAIYRYRCVHPKAGTCPVTMGVQEEEVQNERRQRDEMGVEVEVEIQACVEERVEFRRQKEEAQEKLRQCVDAMERNADNAHENG